MGSIVGFGSYVFLLRHTSGTLATSYSYVNPLVALALGCLLHHEPLGSSTPLATALIVGAVVVMSRPHGAARSASAPGAASQRLSSTAAEGTHHEQRPPADA
jgi:drug/metabolite transporter (DMT)-like permease